MSRQLFQYHPVIGYQFIPGLKVRVPHESGGYLVQCNAQGFRASQNFEVPGNKDGLRILIFGDSFTAGDGVSNKYRYSDLLSLRLDVPVEVYNFGLSETGTDQQYLIYQEFAREIEADLIVVSPHCSESTGGERASGKRTLPAVR